MSPIDELRMIARTVIDPTLEFVIERWIQRHVVELTSTLRISEKMKKEGRYHDALEYERERQLHALAKKVLADGAQVTNSAEGPYDTVRHTVHIIRKWDTT